MATLSAARSGSLRIIALAAILALAGCVGQSDLDQIRNDQMQIRSMIATQNQQVQGLQQQLARQHDALEEMSHGPAGSESTGEQVTALQDRLNKLEASVSAMQTGTVSPPTTGGPAPVSPPAATSPAPAPDVVREPEWHVDLDRELATTIAGPGSKPYRDGLQAMKDGQYPAAIAKFSLLQKRYPKSPLTEPGEYFSANALFELGRYDQSILQFNDLVMRDPKGRFASAALLREAEAFLKLNDKIDARLTLQKLLADHADSPEAAPANEMMEDLQG